MTDEQFNGSIPGGVKRVLKLVGDDVKNGLATISQNWRSDKWAIADITNLLKAQVHEHKVEAGMMDVYFAVSILLQEEVSPRTVRYYAGVGDFYAHPVREKYERLPFSHFDYAMMYPEWEQILEWELDFYANSQRTPAMREVEAYCATLLHDRQEGLNHEASVLPPAMPGRDLDAPEPFQLFNLPQNNGELAIVKARPDATMEQMSKASAWFRKQLHSFEISPELKYQINCECEMLESLIGQAQSELGVKVVA